MKLDRYEVLCREDGSIYRLGQGSTSASYKALDLDLQTPVVLKVIRPEWTADDTARQRFLREARASALLRHPQVAQIYRLGEEDGTYFYAREFVEGETLETIVQRDGPMEVEQALTIALQLAQALVAMKKLNLIHREIKPSNLMMTPEGTVKIIDFGLAKSNDHGAGNGLGAITLSGFVGSPHYASPEQLNETELDAGSDMYSLGVTLWFLLTGRPPFRGPTAQVMAQHLQSPPPFEELGGLSPAVVSLLAHLLEKDAARRPATPSQLVEEIEACLGRQSAGQSPVVPPPMVTATAAPMLELKKVSAAREPVVARPRERFAFAEMLIGTGIAVVVYFILSRPMPAPAPAAPAAPQMAVATGNAISAK